MEGVESLGKVRHRHKMELQQWDKEKKALLKAAKKDKAAQQSVEMRERELLERHARELKAASASVESGDEPQVVSQKEEKEKEKETEQQKTKKKQARDAKREEKRNMIERIGDAFESASKTGLRAQEVAKIEQKLTPLDLTLCEMPADGSCLFASVSHQLHETHHPNAKSTDELRQVAAKWMREHADEFIGFTTSDKTGDMMTPDEFNDYCDRIRDGKDWGSQLEIVAITKALGCTVVIYSADSPEIVIDNGREEAPLRITFHKHFFTSGDHYNSVQKKQLKGV